MTKKKKNALRITEINNVVKTKLKEGQFSGSSVADQLHLPMNECLPPALLLLISKDAARKNLKVDFRIDF